MVETTLTGSAPASFMRTTPILLAICIVVSLSTPFASAGDITDEGTVSANGDDPGQTAIAFQDQDRPGKTVVRIDSGTGGDPVSTTLNGTVRSLLFDTAGSRVLAVVHHQAKRKPAVTHLVGIDTRNGKTDRILSLPLTATAMAYRSTTGSVLVSCQDEIRSYQAPGFVSGPLFRLLGPNGPIVVLRGADRILVGKADGVYLLDLTDPHGTEQMPVHEILPTVAPVDSLVVSEDRAGVQVTTADGESFIALLDPLRREGSAPSPPPMEPPNNVRLEAEEPHEPETVLEEQVVPPSVISEPVAEKRVAEEQVADPVEVPKPAIPAPEEPPVEQDETGPPEIDPIEMEDTADSGTGAVHGRLDGKAASRVRWVRLLGPNNLLTEARRITPAPDGRWSCPGLSPGSYRIVLDAGGQQVVISSPPFLMIEVEAGKKVTSAPFEVLDVR